MQTRDLSQQLAGDVDSRQRVQTTEHPTLSRLVVLRVALNHEFGHQFQPFDHELAQVELALAYALNK